MEPLSKRPRLSCFGSPSDDAELDVARYHNDQALKSRFEQIFKKYSRDFEGIGDEVDLGTGEIILNNGHLERMTNEKDIGEASAKTTDPYGASLLRAMTVAPEDPDYVYPVAQEVVQSIETIADNVIVINDSSEDDLFDQPRSSSPQSWETSESLHERDDSPKDDFDHDSIPHRRHLRRSSSADSLFEIAQSPHGEIEFGRSSPPLSPIQQTLPQSTPGEKRRELIREEIRNMMNEQREARIEEAWRIPVRISPLLEPRQQASSDRDSCEVGVVGVQRDLVDSRNPNARSLWAGPQRYRRTKKQIALDRARAEARAESVDPLQEDFASTGRDSATGDSGDEYRPARPRKRRRVSAARRQQRQRSSPTSSVSAASSVDSVEEQSTIIQGSGLDAKTRVAAVMKATAHGVCPYCTLPFATRKGVLQHFDRWLAKSEKHKPSTDPHDHQVMQLIRAGKQPPPGQGPRLIFSDFRILVELHEGFGMPFGQIAKSRVLRTRKTGLKLHEIYDCWRNVPIPGHDAPPPPRWDAFEETIMKTIIRDPAATMTRFRRQLVNKDHLEIGDKLAEMFLHDLNEKYDGKLPTVNDAIAELRKDQSNAAQDDEDEGEENNQDFDEDTVVKQESEDDLSADQE